MTVLWVQVVTPRYAVTLLAAMRTKEVCVNYNKVAESKSTCNEECFEYRQCGIKNDAQKTMIQ